MSHNFIFPPSNFSESDGKGAPHDAILRPPSSIFLPRLMIPSSELRFSFPTVFAPCCFLGPSSASVHPQIYGLQNTLGLIVLASSQRNAATALPDGRRCCLTFTDKMRRRLANALLSLARARFLSTSFNVMPFQRTRITGFAFTLRLG